MDAIEALKTRRSCRSYLEGPIPKEVLEEMVDAGRLAPTGRGEEPWEFVVVTKREDIFKLRDLIGRNGYFLESATACIVVVSRDTKYYLEDGSAATENILLAAHALGVGSCWIAGDKKHYASEVLGFLKAPQGYKLVSLISLGYPKGEIPSKKKRPLSDVIHWGEF